MFKLIDLSIGSFVIVKDKESRPDTFPLTIHGFIKVMNIKEKLVAVVHPSKVSVELEQSGELEELKKKALEETEEAIADEFSD